MRKILAVWLLIFMSFGPTAFAADAVDSTGDTIQRANGGSAGNSKVDPADQRARMAQIGTNPVDINHKTNWDQDNIFVLVRNACGELSYRDPKTGGIKWGNYCLPAGLALDVPRGSIFTLVKDPQNRQEWREVGVLDLPAGQAIVTACGNVFKPADRMIGKLDEGRQCPACSEPRVEYIVPPEPAQEVRVLDVCPNIPGNQEFVPSGMTTDQYGNCQPLAVAKRRVWPWIVGVGLLALAASTLGGGDDEECNNCPDRIPRPAP